MKNATGELQREIQNSATEIQREMNTQGQVDELKDVANDLHSRIVEGVDSKEIAEVEPEIAEEQPENPLKPDESIKR